MKSFFGIITLLSILAFSCSEQTNEETETTTRNTQKIEDVRKQQIKDSIANVEAEQRRIEKAKQDSIIAVEQEKVIGDIVFGMSEKDTKSKIRAFKNETKRPYKIGSHTAYDYYIGEYKYFQIVDFYHEDKLYMVRIDGRHTSWEYYDSEVPKQVNYITDVIEKKYGEANLHNDIEPRYKLKKGHTYLVNKWKIGEKVIEVRISASGTSYPVDVYIYRKDVAEKIKKENEEKEKESTEKAKDVF